MLKESTYPLLPHIRLQACGIGLAQVDQDQAVASAHRLPGRPASESGRYVKVRATRRRPPDLGSARRPFVLATLLVSLVFSFFVTLAFIFLLQVNQIIGSRIFRGLLFGRYHRPRNEDRFVLFVDIVGSTTLAERIGPVGVHQFLNRVVALAADPVDDHRGDIYQYVGDEIVITWTAVDGRRDARPIRCFFAIEAVLKSAADEFTRDFGLAPTIRGALHAGPVIVGEVGGQKRDIVFHGDVMNTTARLEQSARELDRRLVISADAMSRLEGVGQFASEDLGDRVLRGRTSPVQIFAVAERVHPSANALIRDRP